MLDSWRGMGGAMCIAGSKGQDKEPNSLDPSTSTKARACFYLTGSHHEGACEGGTVVGIEDAAHVEDGGHTTASRARARERSRQGGAGDVRARMWLAPRTVCRFLQSLSHGKSPFTATSVFSELRFCFGCTIFAIHSIAYHGDESRPCGRARAGAATATDA
jgi:hypothetical protein